MKRALDRFTGQEVVVKRVQMTMGNEDRDAYDSVHEEVTNSHLTLGLALALALALTLALTLTPTRCGSCARCTIPTSAV